MRAQLEAITQLLAQEMETTGTIVLGGLKIHKNSSNPSPYAGLCHAAVEKFVELARTGIPQAKVDKVAFTTVGDNVWKRSRHVIAEVTMPDGIYTVDPTIRQYILGTRMVYSKDERYPIEYYPNSITKSTMHDGLHN